ncbi:MAG TPA: alpha/beta hydrolase [Spirochaetota bacterium]|nr:alpha/beta hydrolase [Spirochaetota bacterium]
MKGKARLLTAGAAAVLLAVAVMVYIHMGKRTEVLEQNGEWVVLLHGIMRGPGSMDKIQGALERRGYHVMNFGYPSTSESIADSADLLSTAMKKVPPGTTVHFVTHSMGAIVVRYYLANYKGAGAARFVMIAPPNRGSSLAKRLSALPLYKTMLGRAGTELAKVNSSLIEDLPVPRCEFGVIAGGLGNGYGINPLIPGEDDMTVSVEETKLPGMKDFIQIRGQHSLLLLQQEVVDNVISFLEKGAFLH